MKVPAAARSPEVARLFHPPAFAVVSDTHESSGRALKLNEDARQILIITGCAVSPIRVAEVAAAARREPPICPTCRVASAVSRVQAETADALVRCRPSCRRCHRD